MTGPSFELEQSLFAQGYVRVAGVDEVGRGPLAGPVVAAAVVLNPADIPGGLNDSKKLTAKRARCLRPNCWTVLRLGSPRRRWPRLMT